MILEMIAVVVILTEVVLVIDTSRASRRSIGFSRSRRSNHKR